MTWIFQLRSQSASGASRPPYWKMPAVELVLTNGSEGIATIQGQVLRENTTMLTMCRQLGFHVATDPDEPDIYVVKLPLA